MAVDDPQRRRSFQSGPVQRRRHVIQASSTACPRTSTTVVFRMVRSDVPRWGTGGLRSRLERFRSSTDANQIGYGCQELTLAYFDADALFSLRRLQQPSSHPQPADFYVIAGPQQLDRNLLDPTAQIGLRLRSEPNQPLFSLFRLHQLMLALDLVHRRLHFSSGTAELLLQSLLNAFALLMFSRLQLRQSLLGLCCGGLRLGPRLNGACQIVRSIAVVLHVGPRACVRSSDHPYSVFAWPRRE